MEVIGFEFYIKKEGREAYWSDGKMKKDSAVVVETHPVAHGTPALEMESGTFTFSSLGPLARWCEFGGLFEYVGACGDIPLVFV